MIVIKVYTVHIYLYLPEAAASGRSKNCGHGEYIDDILHPQHPQAKIEESPNCTRLFV
jgi:hypothetical protein